MFYLSSCCGIAIFFLATVGSSQAWLPADETAIKAVTETPGLVAFWTFGEKAGTPRLSVGTPYQHSLAEVNGPIARVDGGPYSGYSTQLTGQEYFRIPYEDLQDLNISGPKAEVSMFAVVWVADVPKSRTIAGIWSEGKGGGDDTGTRQYAMLANMPAYGGSRRLTPHISSEGGVSRRSDGSGLPWNADYAATAAKIPEGTWCTLGFTYDSQYIRAYLNGILDVRTLDPVADNREDSYFTSEGPEGKGRGMNPYYHGRGIFRYDAEKHAESKIPPSDFTVGGRLAGGSMTKEAFRGRFGGLAVFNRALSDDEMHKLHTAVDLTILK